MLGLNSDIEPYFALFVWLEFTFFNDISQRINDLQGFSVITKLFSIINFLMFKSEYYEVFSHTQGEPVYGEVGFILKQTLSGLLMEIKLSNVDLQDGQISEDVEVVGVVFQSVLIATNSICVLSLVSVYDTEDMPAELTLEILHQSLINSVRREDSIIILILRAEVLRFVRHRGT